MKKTQNELDVIRESCKICSEAHIEVMHHVKHGIRESYLENVFKSYGLRNYNIKQVSYQCISATGINSSILHYTKNNSMLQNGELVLLDMGFSLHHFASDITTTLPTNVKFTQKQKLIYDLVLKANQEVQSKLKSGVYWPDMQKLAETVILEGLSDIGLVKGNIKEMVDKKVCYLFMPHGVGHLLVCL